MKRSRRELSFDRVIHGGIFENNHITLFPCFTFIPKTGGSFYCEVPLALLHMCYARFEDGIQEAENRTLSFQRSLNIWLVGEMKADLRRILFDSRRVAP